MCQSPSREVEWDLAANGLFTS
uniref:Uncharacterized protein n=1 Tax=Anguilla anguilla TaxID=7936 RepID=A0A0E9R0S2_ANGAN